jgi:hypothetical protein
MTEKESQEPISTASENSTDNTESVHEIKKNHFPTFEKISHLFKKYRKDPTFIIAVLFLISSLLNLSFAYKTVKLSRKLECAKMQTYGIPCMHGCKKMSHRRPVHHSWR